MRYLLALLLILCSCQSQMKSQTDSSQGDLSNAPGWVSVFQTMTSDSQSSINILRPRYAQLNYYVSEYEKGKMNSWKKGREIKVVKTTKGDKIHWEVDRIFVDQLSPNKTYQLSIVNKFRGKAIDWRIFKTIPLKKKEARFIVGSCLSDSFAFEHVRSRIWDQMLEQEAEFMILLGDEVYVDDFDFVKRDEATEFDIWTRYIDSFRKIPLFQDRRLIPILAVWDDHDFGTNNSDKNFKSKDAAKKVFTAFFGGEAIKDRFNISKNGVSFSFTGFGQKFIFMDNRYFRDPAKTAPFGQWGKSQHKWFEAEVKSAQGPVWLANGGQFFTKATLVDRADGSKKQINESFIDDSPKHFKTLLNDLKTLKQPVVFLSGDIHYSEIARVEKELLGYETYEITSSPIHSYIYRSKEGPESWLNNPRRILSAKEHNFLVLDTTLGDDLKVDVTSLGVKKTSPYFKKSLVIRK